jgi:prolipoprotein diacylglyceryltransferase
MYIILYSIGILITYILLQTAVKLENAKWKGTRKMTDDFLFITIICCSILFPIFYFFFFIELLVVNNLVKLLNRKV